MTKKMVMPRTIAFSNLESQHTIKLLPDVETCDHPEFKEKTTKQIKTCYNNPLLWDFSLNMLHFCKEAEVLDDLGEFEYSASISIRVVDDYLNNIQDRGSKYNTKTKIIEDLTSPKAMPFRKSKNKQAYGFPVSATFVIPNDAKTQQDCYLEMSFKKDIFKDIVEDRWQGKWGYIEIPRKLYPIIRSIEVDLEQEIDLLMPERKLEGKGNLNETKAPTLPGDNPHYRLQILSFLQNTPKNSHSSIDIKIENFKRNIIPEFYRREKKEGRKLTYSNIDPLKQEGASPQEAHNFFKRKIDLIHKELVKKHEGIPILRNLFFSETDVNLYYTTSKNLKYHQ